MTKAATFRQLLRDARPLVSPGVYDGYSARLAELMGFKTAATTGAGLANSVLGQPDIGILSLMENVDACRHLARSVSIPMMADADTGYGNAVTVYEVGAPPRVPSVAVPAATVTVTLESPATPVGLAGVPGGDRTIAGSDTAEKYVVLVFLVRTFFLTAATLK